MIYKPYNYQKYAQDFIMKHNESSLILDMGLGKTVITLTAIRELIIKGAVNKVLVIAPLRVAKCTWPDEIVKWDHLKDLTYSVATGSEKERLEALSRKVDIHIINRENVVWLVEKCKFDYDMIVIDELSSFKSYAAKRFKALLKVRPKVKRIVGLTGTPGDLMSLWAEYRLIDFGERLGRYITQYRTTYFVPDKRNGQIIYSYKPKPGAEDVIYKKIQDITMSMKAIDYLDMPDKIINEVKVELSQEEWNTYDGLKEDMVVNLNDVETIDAMNAAVLSGKLLQMANGAIYNDEHKAVWIHDRKLDALEDLIEQANDKPVLVAYWFQHDAERIKKRFKVREIKTEQDIRDWNNGLVSVGIIHPASAGHGLNLQAGGSILIWFGLTWSLELYEQTNARLWRQGQKETVIIHHIIAKDTIDEDVMRALGRKERNQSELIEAVKAKIRR